jgi:hypothetical protein
MSLAPTATVTLGSLRYDSHVTDLHVTLALLPAVNSFVVDLPASVKFTAVPDDDAILVVSGGDDAADGEQTLLTGTVGQVRRTLDHIRVICADGGVALSELRPATTYQGKSAGDVIKALASDAGASIGDCDIDLDLAAYVAHQGRTAAEHIAELARLGGCIATVNADGELDVTVMPGEQADAALLYGRELLSFEKIDAPAPKTRRFAIGNGTAGSTSAPNALKPGLTKLPDDAGAPGPGAVWFPSPVLRTPGTAVAASQALGDAAAARTTRCRAQAFLLTGLRPGMVIEIQELPEELSGNTWLLTRVSHHLDPALGGETTLEGVLAGASGGSLLGALLGAIGGLL